ncbi:MAG: FAD-dependent thymidylate synthase [Candidatus Riflebacteria bacterium]|nr:FAD-dependent thymidylate synthase [Candidatus Riflebacteria bacterium]
MKRIEIILKHVTPEFVVNEAVGMPYDTPPSSELTSKVIGTKKHLSCAEHIVMNWHVIGSSRLELQEHMRHRMASPTVKSSRYTLDKDFLRDYAINTEDLFVTPDLSNLSVEQAAIFSAHMAFITNRVITAVTQCKAKKIPNDYIKYLLPESLRTSFSWTINLRSFINFLELRTDKNAHFEIRHIANEMRRVISESLAAKYIDEILKEMGL